ncbi:TPA: ATP-binding cassette domain-containing protein, partial [Klebsiella pneumoniae]|nr:ATP-binding cassette domain-containing protein [Klebsiella pneumoniae]
DRRIVNDALERVDMLPYRHRQIGELSGGQKKRVFLARSIAQRGKVILLDEPFTGVDVNTEKKIITLLGELKEEGSTLVVSTHNLTSVSEYCDYTVLVKGTVLASGPVATTFTPENIKKTFSANIESESDILPVQGGSTQPNYQPSAEYEDKGRSS